MDRHLDDTEVAARFAAIVGDDTGGLTTDRFHRAGLRAVIATGIAIWACALYGAARIAFDFAHALAGSGA